jgi:DNA-binding LytR/AlgR family response regulator
MKETEKRFLDKGFVRCNNSFLINLARVDQTDGNTVKIGKNEIVVSRARKKQFLDAFSVYYRGL